MVLKFDITCFFFLKFMKKILKKNQNMIFFIKFYDFSEVLLRCSTFSSAILIAQVRHVSLFHATYCLQAQRCFCHRVIFQSYKSGFHIWIGNAAHCRYSASPPRCKDRSQVSKKKLRSLISSILLIHSVNGTRITTSCSHKLQLASLTIFRPH